LPIQSWENACAKALQQLENGLEMEKSGLHRPERGLRDEKVEHSRSEKIPLYSTEEDKGEETEWMTRAAALTG
jgi:hypothetical protein